MQQVVKSGALILFIENGRLGNQLFQYCAMRKFDPSGRILVLGMDDLRSMFTGIEVKAVPKLGSVLLYLVRRYGLAALEYFSEHMRLLTRVDEIQTEIGADFSVKPGLLRRLTYFKAGFYQSECTVEASVMDGIALKPDLLNAAIRILDRLPVHAESRFFVHVRRGDYLYWPSSDSPAVLPLVWYREQMARIRQSHPGAFFVVVSDDQPYVDEFFLGEDDVWVSQEDMAIDFALMTQCLGGGVLSASSFAWWGAYFIHRENPQARLIAPYYWAGVRLREWYPSVIRTSWMEYQPLPERLGVIRQMSLSKRSH